MFVSNVVLPSMNSPYPSVLGATVIAAAGSQSKLDICMTYGGADYVVNYTEKDWQKEVLKITGGKGVDVVYDPVGRIAGELFVFLRVLFGAIILSLCLSTRIVKMHRLQRESSRNWFCCRPDRESMSLLHKLDYLLNPFTASAKPSPAEEYFCHGPPLGVVCSCAMQYIKWKQCLMFYR